MPRPVRFKVKKWGSLWLVTGRVSIGDSIGVEPYQASFTSAKAADKEAARIVDCVRDSASRWFCGPFGFVLADATPLPFMPCKGQLGFFTPPREAVDRLAAALSKD